MHPSGLAVPRSYGPAAPVPGGPRSGPSGLNVAMYFTKPHICTPMMKTTCSQFPPRRSPAAASPIGIPETTPSAVLPPNVLVRRPYCSCTPPRSPGDLRSTNTAATPFEGNPNIINGRYHKPARHHHIFLAVPYCLALATYEMPHTSLSMYFPHTHVVNKVLNCRHHTTNRRHRLLHWQPYITERRYHGPPPHWHHHIPLNEPTLASPIPCPITGPFNPESTNLCGMWQCNAKDLTNFMVQFLASLAMMMGGVEAFRSMVWTQFIWEDFT